MAFSAGFFLCIALGDLLPEVQFHTHDRWKLSAALLGGVALALAIEMTHSHESHAGHDHAHASHEHRPQSFDEAVTLIQDLGSEVSQAFRADDAEAAHGALHELGSLLVALPGLIDESDLSEDDKAAAKQSGEELFASYDQLDRLMHGPEIKKKASTAFEEVKDSISKAMGTLTGLAKSEHSPH